MASDRETRIQKALADLKNGTHTSLRAAAKAYSIPRSTLQTRMNGGTNAQIGHQFQQRLSPKQEEFLVKWVMEQDRMGFPPSHPPLREMANDILEMDGNTTPLGKGWVTGFLRRNPTASSVTS